MEIGSNKLKLQGVIERLYPPPIDYERHNLSFIDPINKQHNFSKHKFAIETRKKLELILQQNRIPLLVGGSPLFISQFLEGETERTTTDVQQQKKLIEEMEKSDSKRIECIKWIKERDPVFYQSKLKTHSNNLYRVARSKLMLQSLPPQESMMQFFQKNHLDSNLFQSQNGSTYPIRSFCILPNDRINLYRKIDHNCEKMIQDGFSNFLI